VTRSWPSSAARRSSASARPTATCASSGVACVGHTCSACNAVSGNKFYVDPVNGNDLTATGSNMSGTSVAPGCAFKTISQAIHQMPATPFAALEKGGYTPANRLRMLGLTAPASLAGLPVLTIPVPLPSGLSTGLQIMVVDPKSPVISWALKLAA